MLKLSEFLGSAITSSLQLNFKSEKGWSKGQFRWRFLLLSLLVLSSDILHLLIFRCDSLPKFKRQLAHCKSLFWFMDRVLEQTSVTLFLGNAFCHLIDKKNNCNVS
jgi:hypothetical protein